MRFPHQEMLYLSRYSNSFYDLLNATSNAASRWPKAIGRVPYSNASFLFHSFRISTSKKLYEVSTFNLKSSIAHPDKYISGENIITYLCDDNHYFHSYLYLAPNPFINSNP